MKAILIVLLLILTFNSGCQPSSERKSDLPKVVPFATSYDSAAILSVPFEMSTITTVHVPEFHLIFANEMHRTRVPQPQEIVTRLQNHTDRNKMLAHGKNTRCIIVLYNKQGSNDTIGLNASNIILNDVAFYNDSLIKYVRSLLE